MVWLGCLVSGRRQRLAADDPFQESASPLVLIDVMGVTDRRVGDEQEQQEEIQQQDRDGDRAELELIERQESAEQAADHELPGAESGVQEGNGAHGLGDGAGKHGDDGCAGERVRDEAETREPPLRAGPEEAEEGVERKEANAEQLA